MTSETELTNVTFYLWNSTEKIVYNETKNISSTQNSSYFEFNFTSLSLTEGNYTWNCLTFNEDNESNYALTNFTINYDLTLPLIQNLSVTKTYNSATISWATTELANSSIELIEKENQSSSSYSLNHSFSFSSLSASTTYNYNVTNCDLAGNCNSTNSSFITSSAPVSSSGGGGGGGGGSTTITQTTPDEINPTEEELEEGHTKEITTNNIIHIQVKNQNHKLTLTNVASDFAVIKIESNPIEFSLFVGGEKKLNLTSKDYYDLLVKLNSIINGKANLTIRTIEEAILQIEEESDETNGGAEIKEDENVKDGISEKWVFSLGFLLTFSVLIILTILIYFVVIVLEHKSNKKALRKKKIKEVVEFWKKHK
jgi:chitodextrinase